MTPQVGDLVTLKGDDKHLWRVKGFCFAIGTHVREAWLELVGEAWVRTKCFPVADLSVQPADLEDFERQTG